MRWQVLQTAGSLAMALLLAHCAGAPSVAGDSLSPLIDPAVRITASAGKSRVIVELRIAPVFKPEGDLPDATAVVAQRQAIAKAQSDLLSRLAGTKFSISHQYDSLPFMALEVAGDALSRLEASGDLVTRVQADTTRVPQR